MPDIANREHARHARLERFWTAAERRPPRGEFVGRELRVRVDEAVVVHRHIAEPLGRRCRPDEAEQAAAVDRVRCAGPPSRTGTTRGAVSAAGPTTSAVGRTPDLGSPRTLSPGEAGKPARGAD